MSEQPKRISWAKADAAIRVAGADLDAALTGRSISRADSESRTRLRGALGEVRYLWNNGSITNAQAFYEAKRIAKQAPI